MSRNRRELGTVVAETIELIEDRLGNVEGWPPLTRLATFVFALTDQAKESPDTLQAWAVDATAADFAARLIRCLAMEQMAALLVPEGGDQRAFDLTQVVVGAVVSQLASTRDGNEAEQAAWSLIRCCDPILPQWFKHVEDHDRGSG